MVPLLTTGVAATANSGASMSKNRAAVIRMCLVSLEKDLGEAGLAECLSARCLDPHAARQCHQVAEGLAIMRQVRPCLGEGVELGTVVLPDSGHFSSEQGA